MQSETQIGHRLGNVHKSANFQSKFQLLMSFDCGESYEDFLYHTMCISSHHTIPFLSFFHFPLFTGNREGRVIFYTTQSQCCQLFISTLANH
uniref:Uncharacterized protein n=1 Tax=Rhizophora mucronata TaxID=61149 RepID=A0A2P2QVR8_RHIMU